MRLDRIINAFSLREAARGGGVLKISKLRGILAIPPLLLTSAEYCNNLNKISWNESTFEITNYWKLVLIWMLKLKFELHLADCIFFTLCLTARLYCIFMFHWKMFVWITFFWMKTEFKSIDYKKHWNWNSNKMSVKSFLKFIFVVIDLWWIKL